VIVAEPALMRMAPPDAFSARFANWARWCVQKGLYRGRAGSVEGAYSGPQGNGHPSGWGDWEEAAPPLTQPKIAVDVPDAIEVNRAYVSLWTLSPTNAHVIKVMTFRAHWPPRWQAQKLGIHWSRLDEAYARAKKMLSNQIGK
jgi:hypothetical protein